MVSVPHCFSTTLRLLRLPICFGDLEHDLSGMFHESSFQVLESLVIGNKMCQAECNTTRLLYFLRSRFHGRGQATPEATVAVSIFSFDSYASASHLLKTYVHSHILNV